MYGTIYKSFNVHDLDFSIEYTWNNQLHTPELLSLKVQYNGSDITASMNQLELESTYIKIQNLLLANKLEVEFECAEAYQDEVG